MSERRTQMRTEGLSFLGVEVTDGVAIVTFNRNTWAHAEEWELFQVLDDLRSDDEVRAVVLTGKGDTFCGGAHDWMIRSTRSTTTTGRCSCSAG